MIAPLLVGVAHGLDLVTFMLALTLTPITIDGEWNVLARMAYASAGLAGVVLLKASGTVALALIVHMRRWALLPATVPGIIGATVNLLAIAIVTR
jgi:biotin transporter BioY